MRLAEGELLRFIACCSRGCKILSNFAAKPRNRSCGPSHFLGGMAGNRLRNLVRLEKGSMYVYDAQRSNQQDPQYVRKGPVGF